MSRIQSNSILFRIKVYQKLKSDREERTFKKTIKPIQEATQTKSKVNDSIVHTVRHSEQFAFSKWINQYIN